MTHSSLTNGVQITSDSSSRGGVDVDRFIVHHAATTSLAAILSLFQPGGRTVSANYALGNDGTLVLAVDEDRRAWTSSSSYWDGRAVTIECANSVAGGSWPVSDATFDKLARLIADVATRHQFPITDDTILTHQELYIRYGDSYATSCPGDLQRRKAELLDLARKYQAPAFVPAPIIGDDMLIYLPTSNSSDGVIKGGLSYIQQGNDPLRPLSRAEYGAYDYFAGKSEATFGYKIPVRWIKWSGDEVRNATRYIGVLEHSGIAPGDVPILTGNVIYDTPTAVASR